MGVRNRSEVVPMAAWKPPAIIAAVAVAIVGGFYLGGPGLGMAVGALAAASIVVMAVRQAPRGPIVAAPLADLRRHLLLVSAKPLEHPQTVDHVARLARDPESDIGLSEIRLLTPSRARPIDRWSGDRRGADAAAQRNSMLTLATLATAGLTATASVGDEDVVLAVEDELRTYPATDVIMVTSAAEGPGGEVVATELRTRLQVDFLHLTVPAADPRDPRSPGEDGVSKHPAAETARDRQRRRAG